MAVVGPRRERGLAAAGAVILLAAAAVCALVAAPRQRGPAVLLGGDDWLGAPLAVPDDVRDHGEQKIGEDVTYWNTHSGQIGTGGSSGGGATYP